MLGEYPDKREVANFRIRPDTKRLLEAAARKSGRTVSQETEHQLRRALVGKSGATAAVVSAVGLAIDGLIAGSPVAERWLKDPRAFDQVAGCFAAAIAMFRPIDSVVEVETEIEQFAPAARRALFRLMARAVDASETPPADRRSQYEHVLALLAGDLGPLSARPVIHEMHAMRCPLCHRLSAEPAKEDAAS
jgi:hypothetical protein